MNRYHELGAFGNIWVRQHVLDKAGDSNPGHEHKFDHVTLLAAGKVSVQIQGKPSKEFTAPTFIVIRKEHKHKITALSDDVIYYCVFALRDVDGEILDDIYGAQHDPLCAAPVEDGYWDKVKKIEHI